MSITWAAVPICIAAARRPLWSPRPGARSRRAVWAFAGGKSKSENQGPSNDGIAKARQRPGDKSESEVPGWTLEGLSKTCAENAAA
eukprot:9073133-Alexandrium_andersonii.AAC.1